MHNPTRNTFRSFLHSLLVALLTVALLSCGGGGSSDDSDTTPSGSDDNSSSGDGSNGDSSDSGTSSNPADIDPVTPLGNSQSQSIPGVGTITMQSGSDGALEVDAQTQSIQLVNGTPSMNVVEVNRVQAIDMSCDNGDSIHGSMTSVYSTGVVSLSGEVNGQSITCSSTFNSILPITIATVAEVEALLEDWGDDLLGDDAANSGFISTTCPSTVDDADIEPFTNSCDGSILENYTVTDDQGGVHKLSRRYTFSSDGGAGDGTSTDGSTDNGTTPGDPGDGITATFSGSGAIDPPSASSPGTTFTNVDYNELSIGDQAANMTWSDSNGTTIAIIPSATDPTKAALVSISLPGGAAWLSNNAAEVVGVTISATAVTFNNVLVTDGTTSISINGTLNRADP